MSLLRLVYYSALAAGWAACVGWLVSEVLFAGKLRDAVNPPGWFAALVLSGLIGAVVGGAIGAGINLVAGLANAQWKQLLLRAATGLVCGAVSGLLGAFVGQILAAIGLPRALGWMVLGAAIGVVDGLYEHSKSKIRNGLIGGLVGGLLGGVLFDLIPWMLESSIGLASGTGMSSRATGFVVLGVCIGAMIAWPN